MVDLEGRILVEFNKWSKSMELLWQDSYTILSLKDKFLDSLYIMILLIFLVTQMVKNLPSMGETRL